MQNLSLICLKLFLEPNVLVNREASFASLPGYLVAKIIFFSGCLYVLLGLEHFLQPLALQAFVMVLVELSKYLFHSLQQVKYQLQIKQIFIKVQTTQRPKLELKYFFLVNFYQLKLFSFASFKLIITWSIYLQYIQLFSNEENQKQAKLFFQQVQKSQTKSEDQQRDKNYQLRRLEQKKQQKCRKDENSTEFKGQGQINHEKQQKKAETGGKSQFPQLIYQNLETLPD